MLSIFHVPVGHLYVSLEKCIFISSAHFKIRLLGLFSLMSDLSSLYILDTSPLSYMYALGMIFFHLVDSFFILWIFSLHMQKLLVGCSPTCLFTFSLSLLLVSDSNYCQDLCQSLRPMFPSRNFYGFRSYI